MAWTHESQPFGPNHAPTLTGWATDGSGSIPVAVDPATGALITEASATGDTASGVYNSTPPTLTNGQSSPIQLDSSGRIYINAAPLSSATDSVTIVNPSPTTILNGKTTVSTAGTAVVLATTTACSSVTVKALATNTGLVYVGNSSVSSSNGFQLQAGDSISMDIANLATVYLDTSVNGSAVTYLGVL